jgi:hypothetical protein
MSAYYTLLKQGFDFSYMDRSLGSGRYQAAHDREQLAVAMLLKSVPGLDSGYDNDTYVRTGEKGPLQQMADDSYKALESRYYSAEQQRLDPDEFQIYADGFVADLVGGDISAIKKGLVPLLSDSNIPLRGPEDTTTETSGVRYEELARKILEAAGEKVEVVNQDAPAIELVNVHMLKHVLKPDAWKTLHEGCRDVLDGSWETPLLDAIDKVAPAIVEQHLGRLTPTHSIQAGTLDEVRTIPSIAKGIQ